LPGGGTDNGPLGCAAAADTPAATAIIVASVVRISRDKWCMIVFFLTSGSSNFRLHFWPYFWLLSSNFSLPHG